MDKPQKEHFEKGQLWEWTIGKLYLWKGKSGNDNSEQDKPETTTSLAKKHLENVNSERETLRKVNSEKEGY